MHDALAPAWSILSERERDVIRLSAEGLTDAEVGDKLGIAAETVRSHWKRIRKRTGGLARPQIVGLFTQVERNPYRELFDNLPCGAMLVSSRGRILDANRGMADMLLTSRSGLVGRSILDVFACEGLITRVGESARHTGWTDTADARRTDGQSIALKLQGGKPMASGEWALVVDVEG